MDINVNGNHFVELVVKPSNQKGIDNSQGMNRCNLLLHEAGYKVYNKHEYASDTKEVKMMKNATGSLKLLLGSTIGMAAHPRNRNGRKSYPNDVLPWYNMPMAFFFKGRISDVTKDMIKVETPSEEEVAMLVELAEMRKKK